MINSLLKKPNLLSATKARRTRRYSRRFLGQRTTQYAFPPQSIGGPVHSACGGFVRGTDSPFGEKTPKICGRIRQRLVAGLGRLVAPRILGFLSRLLVLGLIALQICSWSISYAASTSQVQVDVRAIPDRATIGDQIRLYVQIERPRKYALEPLSNQLNLAPFEIKKVEFLPYGTGKNRVRETFVLTLTVFELGDLQIPSFAVRFRTGKESRQDQVMTASVPVKVVSVGKKPTDKGSVRPIKDPVSPDLTGIWYSVYGFAVALLAAFLWIKVILRRRKTPIDPESLKAPHERVFLELARLKKMGFLAEHKIKEFYSGLSDILRRYVERRYGILALEQTTLEIMARLKESGLEKSSLEKIEALLRQADLVKFAKFVPPGSLADDLEKLIAEIVNETKPAEESPK